MGWAKLDDGFAWHPKLRRAGLEASGLDARAFSYCARYETDGFVEDVAVADLAGDPAKGKKLAKVLVDVGRWERDAARGGYVVHDYLEYNPSRAELERRREAERAKKAKARTRAGRDDEGRFVPGGQDRGRTGGIPPGVPEAVHPAVPEGIPGGVHPYPVPTRPVSDSSSPKHRMVGAAVDDDETTDGPTTPTPTDVARLVAERRLGRQRPGTVRSPSGWKREVARDVLAESEALIAAALEAGSHPEAIAAELDPDPRPGEAEVEWRTCCRSTVSGPHVFGCDAVAEPTWELDEAGVAVRR